MSDMSQDLVTKIDVIPDLAGLNSFEAAIDRATAKVNQLDAAIKRVNNLKPASQYAPSGASSMPTAATTAAVAAITASGANLVSRTPLADTVKREAQKVAQSAVKGISSAVGGGGGGLLLPPPSGGGWSAGRAGGLWDPNAGNPLARYDTSAGSFSRTPLTPTADAVKKATSGSGLNFGLDNMLAGAGLTAGVVAGYNAMAASLDTIQQQQAQIARLAQTTGDAKQAFLDLNQAASDVRSDSGAFISTYTNMATATQKLGYSQEETIKATQGLVGALQLGGGSAEAVNAALYQMGQAFSSDRFGGDEFRSFMEAIGTMAPEVAKAFGTDVKGLRQMSEQGKLTAEAMFKAFEKMAANNADLLKKQGWTWGQVTTVMKNDWQAFLAEATIGGEWQKFTDWAANTLIPIARGAEKELARFWSTLADESKSAILIGILGAVGAAFTALAIPVLAALWPFLAIGAAVWIVYEAFVEWKAWMNGEGGTIFDSLFGSFDAFEKRYPAIMKMLRAISGGAEDATTSVNTGGGSSENGAGFAWGELLEPGKLFGNAYDFLKQKGNDFNPLNGIEGLLNMFTDESSLSGAAVTQSQNKGGVVVNNSNSGNKQVQIMVGSAKEAADTVNNLDNPGTISDDLSGNIASTTGAL
ncbi:MAG: tail tape measure protein [Gammaproteobacteria bacterium]|nr:tail tape measure protein [Gammaproteobacteria bacterium]